MKKLSGFLILLVCAFFIFPIATQASFKHLGEFGSYGSSEGQFSQPRDIAIDTLGNLYVADMDNQRIQKFDSSGQFLMMFGWGVDDGSDEYQICASDCEAGIGGGGDGQFMNPEGVAVDSSGNIYVTDRSNNRVQKFDAAGNFILMFGKGVDDGSATFQICTSDCQAGTFGNGNGNFSSPTNIVINSSGGLFVADAGNSRIQEFDLVGNFVAKITNSDSTMQLPRGIAFDSNDNLFITDPFHDFVKKFDSNNAFVSTFGSHGSGHFTDPYDIAEYRGALFVIDPTDNALRQFDADGELKIQYDQLSGPVALVRDLTGTLYVADTANNRIQKIAIPRAIISNNVFTLTEGNNDSFDIALGVPPSSDVTVTLEASAPDSGSGLSVSPAVLTFTTANWNTPQTVQIETVDDNIYYPDRDVDVNLAISSNDSFYNNFVIDPITVSITDDDVPLVDVSDSSVEVTEGRSPYEVTFSLLQQPTDNVTVTFSSSVATSGVGIELAPQSLTFTPDDYATPQTLQVIPLNDFVQTGDRTVTITAVVSSNDTEFDGSQMAPIPVHIIEDDRVGILISSCAELQAISNDLTETYTLANDIDCSGFDPNEDGKGFVPIGDVGNYAFTGTLNGNGHTISNLNINRPDEDYVGLFGYIESANISVSNLNLTGTVRGHSYVGSLLGKSTVGILNISNVKSSVHVIGVEQYIGGIIGNLSTPDIVRLNNLEYTGQIDIDVEGGVDYVGGIAGYISGTKGEFTSFVSTGAINIEGTYVDGIGGLIGYTMNPVFTKSLSTSHIKIKLKPDSGGGVQGIGGLIGYADADITINNSFWNGVIEATSTGSINGIGGLLGYTQSYTSTISNSYSVGDFVLTAAADIDAVGGIIGLGGTLVIENSFAVPTISVFTQNLITYIGSVVGNTGDYTITNSYYNRTISGPSCVGGVYPDHAGCTAIENNTGHFKNSQYNQPLNTWDFTNIWATLPDNYPKLRGVYSPYAEPAVVVPVQPSGPSGGGGGGGGGSPTIIYPNNTNTNTATSSPTSTTTPVVNNSFCPKGFVCTQSANNGAGGTVLFPRDLKLNAKGDDVKELQKFLNRNGFIISKTGAGSKGKETTLFGPATRNAVIRFQKYYKITPASGYFGPVTKKFIETKFKVK